MRPTIAETVQRLVSGADFAGSVELLRADRRQAIDYLVSVLAGYASYQIPAGIDPRDAHTDLEGALAALGQDDVGYLVDLLSKALESTNVQPAFSLTWVLAHLDRPEAADVLMAALKHRNGFVRWAACIGVRRLRLRRARTLLNAAAADRDSSVRHEAVDALRQLGDESSLPVLRRRLSDRYPGIRVAAQRAIDAIDRRTGRGRGKRSRG